MNNYNYNRKHSSIHEDRSVRESPLVNVVVDEVMKRTAKALLFLIDGEEVWVPISLIEDEATIGMGDTEVVVAIPLWFAKKEGLPWEE